MASPANLNMSPPDLFMAFTSNSMYLFKTYPRSSCPSFPLALSFSDRLVNPETSENIATVLIRVFLGSVSACSLDILIKSSTTIAGKNPIRFLQFETSSLSSLLLI